MGFVEEAARLDRARRIRSMTGVISDKAGDHSDRDALRMRWLMLPPEDPKGVKSMSYITTEMTIRPGLVGLGLQMPVGH